MFIVPIAELPTTRAVVDEELVVSVVTGLPDDVVAHAPAKTSDSTDDGRI
jgi:hypothetical protein